MHSFIYQLGAKKIEEDDILTEYDLYDDFVGNIADYVNEDVDQDEAINDLIEFLQPYGIVYNNEENSIVFQNNFKRNYFAKRFNNFKEKANIITLEDFAGYTDNLNLFFFKQLIEEKYAFYIYIDGNYMTLDEFVRNMKEEKKYYFGSAIDYHF